MLRFGPEVPDWRDSGFVRVASDVEAAHPLPELLARDGNRIFRATTWSALDDDVRKEPETAGDYDGQ
jgi:hypothetical protein